MFIHMHVDKYDAAHKAKSFEQPLETIFLLQATRPPLHEFVRSQLWCYSAGKTLLIPHLFRKHCDPSTRQSYVQGA